jgi:hypothetical protein
MKILKEKPRRGPSPKDLIMKAKQVEMKNAQNSKRCKPSSTTTARKRPTTKKEKKIEERKGEQDDFLLFLKEEEGKEHFSL